MQGTTLPDCDIVLEKVSIYLGGEGVIRNVTVRMGPKGFHVIAGPNGAGKTTLIKAIAGVIEYNGLIEVCGTKPRLASRHIAYSPATPSYDPWARVIDVMEAGVYRARRSLDPGEAANYLKRLGLEGYLYRRFGELSSGEQKLVDIARSLARNPKVLLLDEPLAFLDLRNQARIIRLLRELSRITTVVATMHELHFLDFSDQVIILDKGSIAYAGNPRGVPLDLLAKIYKTRISETVIEGKRYILPIP